MSEHGSISAIASGGNGGNEDRLKAALQELVGFLEEHRAYCKRVGERPIIDAARLARAKKALHDK